MFLLKKKIAISNEKERMNVLYGDEFPKIVLSVSEDIRMKTENGEKKISFSSIEDVVETKNLIVCLLKGSMTLSFSKQGFVKGNEKEFLNYIKEKMK